jgi:CheY-like chemotaxis protein
MSPQATGPLFGLSVLIVEDEFLIAAEAQQVAELGGASVTQLASTIDQARACLAGAAPPDVVVLDLGLGYQNGAVLMHDLAELKIPFVIASGFAAVQTGQYIPTGLREKPEVLIKPYSETDLLSAMAAAAARRTRV